MCYFTFVIGKSFCILTPFFRWDQTCVEMSVKKSSGSYSMYLPLSKIFRPKKLSINFLFICSFILAGSGTNYSGIFQIPRVLGTQWRTCSTWASWWSTTRSSSPWGSAASPSSRWPGARGTTKTTPRTTRAAPSRRDPGPGAKLLEGVCGVYL